MKRLIVFAWIGLLAAGCSDDPETDTTLTFTETQAALFFEAQAESMCDQLERCEQDFGRFFSDREQCVAITTRINSFGVDPNSLRIAPEQAVACVEAIRASDCSVPTLAFRPLECDPEAFFRGTVPVGECCSPAELCVAGADCREDVDGEDRCVARGDEGSTCRSNRDCAAGLGCLSAIGAEGTCVMLRTEGETCILDAPQDGFRFPDVCAEPLVCEFDSGLCSQRRPAGSECGSDRQCASGKCLNDLEQGECNTVEDGRCPGRCARPRAQLPRLGEPCENECALDALGRPHSCVDNDGQRICVAERTVPGLSCDPSRFDGITAPSCSDFHGLMCDASTLTCIALPQLGEPCTGDCQPLDQIFCSEGSVCEPRRTLGQSCRSGWFESTVESRDCEPGLLCVSGRCQTLAALSCEG